MNRRQFNTTLLALATVPLLSCDEQKQKKRMSKAKVLRLLGRTRQYGVELLKQLVLDKKAHAADIRVDLIDSYPGLFKARNRAELDQLVKQMVAQDIREGRVVKVKWLFFSELEHLIFQHQAALLN